MCGHESGWTRIQNSALAISLVDAIQPIVSTLLSPFNTCGFTARTTGPCPADGVQIWATIMAIMPGRTEQLFHQLTSAHAIRALIGQSEDAHFDCKKWPTKDEDAQRVFAKATCGLANAEGGVLVVGMMARTISKDEPDLVNSTAPVADTGAVKSRILDLVGQLVEPGIEGIEAIEVNEPSGSKSGFVIVHIPASQGPRSIQTG
jgi:hypothetical protein